MHIILSYSNGQQHTLNVGAVAILIVAWIVVLTELAKQARARRMGGCHGS